MGANTFRDTTRTTKYAKLRDLISDQIATGTLSKGDFLPSEPVLAKRFEISRSTVRQAIAELETDGLVERIPGKGTLVLQSSALAPPRPMPSAASRPTVPPTVSATPQALSVFTVVLPELKTGHYPALVQHFEQAASDLMRQTIFCTTGNDVRRQGDIILQLIDKRVAGVALSPPTVGAVPTHQIRQLQLNGIPVVLLHRGVTGITAPIIEIPYETVAERAAEVLLEQGHRRIAFIGSHASASTERYRHSFAKTLEAHGASLPEELVWIGNQSIAEAGTPNSQRLNEVEVAFDKMMALPGDRRPTAAFDPWDADAEAIYLTLLQRGMSIPKDFSIISFGGASGTGTLSSRISSITLDEHHFALKAVELLENMVKGDLRLNDDSRFLADLGFRKGETLKSVN
ncbi:GntR family transcriptional regulator [Aeoliella mucimassa]|uniref:Catabolite control protein A n=1 Tax=Aeoliella mucimassa TaxID=2527972 RepID=A0A518AQ80_9BACT|nr:GntR family transcriptional regulator [Aeoliella mucimassa]QDU56880.1 Catabolite control protein A [Aeoliella mucimassa]